MTTLTQQMTFNKVTVNTAAQAITLIAYGDTSNGERANIPFRSLDYRVKCEDFKDFLGCINLIDSYNNFDASKMAIVLQQYLDLKKFVNDNNANNGRPFFTFEIARESSPAFYVSYLPLWDKYILNNGLKVPYTLEAFRESMEDLKDLIQADEMDITVTEHQIEARFWFD